MSSNELPRCIYCGEQFRAHKASILCERCWPIVSKPIELRARASHILGRQDSPVELRITLAAGGFLYLSLKDEKLLNMIRFKLDRAGVPTKYSLNEREPVLQAKIDRLFLPMPEEKKKRGYIE